MISLIEMCEFEQGGTMIDQDVYYELKRRKDEYGTIWVKESDDED